MNIKSSVQVAVAMTACALVPTAGQKVHAGQKPTDAESVSVSAESFSLPWWTSRSVGSVDPFHPRARTRLSGSEDLAGQRSFDAIVLENEYLRVRVCPEIGGAIASATCKLTGEDIFFREGQAKDWLPFWESGVKASFPFREHGIQTVGQGASWRIFRRDDGSVTLAMWMEFSRFSGIEDRWIYGRYSNMTLSQLVTLRPGESSFSTTCAIVNPPAYKQGRRLWVDIILPREHTKQGVIQGRQLPPQNTTTEWIFPAAYVSSHNGANLRPYSQKDTPIAAHDGTPSIFAWDYRFGFAGLWYPRVGVNRLILFDPNASPGCKQWFHAGPPPPPDHWWLFKYNFVELWQGTDSVFEGVENWIQPGERFAMTQHYTMIHGLGKVDFANKQLAVHVELDSDEPKVQLASLKTLADVTVLIDGKAIARADVIRPGKHLVVKLDAPLDAARVTVRSGDAALLDRRFPLEIPRETSRHALIREACKRTPVQLERGGNNAHLGETFRTAIGRYPAGSVGRGRLLLRDGYLRGAIRCLQQALAVDANSGEAHHLLGVALLERGRSSQASRAFRAAVEAEHPHSPARYFLAMLALAAEDQDEAVKQLTQLGRDMPSHWEGRLLLTATLAARSETRDLAAKRLAALQAEDPADPRAAWIAAKLVDPEDPAASRTLRDLMKEAGATRRIEEFRKATRGTYVSPERLGY